MKDVLSLTVAIKDNAYYADMFSKWGEDKNILFVCPQLSGKHLYKSILPFFCLRNKRDGIITTATAMTSLKKYDYTKQLMDFEIDLTDDMVDWADYIVFPFTTQPLSEEIYTRIRELKPETKIVYSVDFNFYELSPNHPYKEIFSEEMVINDVEDNMYFADLVLLDNVLFVEYISKKFDILIKGKYDGVQGFMTIAAMPTMIDSEIVLKNVDGYEPENASVVKKETIHEPAVEELIEKTEKVKEEVKNKNFKEKEKNKKSEPIKNKPIIKKTKVVKNGKHTGKHTADKSKKSIGKPKPSAAKSGKHKRSATKRKR
jgi:hypothetical protein